MEKNNPVSNQTAAQAFVFLHLLLYAALACTTKTLQSEPRSKPRVPAWRDGRMEMHHLMALENSQVKLWLCLGLMCQ